MALILGVAFGFVAIGAGWAISTGRGQGTVAAALDDGSISCSLDGASPDATTAEATTQGVPLQVRSDAAGLIFFAIGEEGAPFDTFSLGLDPGLNDIVLPVPPGTLRFGCFAAPFDAGAVDEQLLRSITVSDPYSYWVPPSLSCADPRFWTVSELPDFPGSSYVSGAYAQAGEPLQKVASRELPWLRPTDEVVAAMYPESDGFESVLVMRERQGVALVTRLTQPDAASSSPMAQIRFRVCPSAEEVEPTS